MNLYNFLVKKPVIYIMTHWFGHKVEDKTSAELDALEPQVIDTLKSLVGPKISALIAADGTLVVSAVHAAIVPEADTLIAAAIAAVPVPTSFEQVAPQIKSKLTTYAEAQFEGVVDILFSELTAKGN